MTPRRPPTGLIQDAYVSVLRTASELERAFAELFKRHELSPAQYNVLRILRGAGPEGATCGDVGGRLMRHDPDVTRLVDRLAQRGLVARGRDARDRRVVRTRITEAGRKLLADLDHDVEALHREQLGHMSEEALGRLIGLLGEARRD